MDRRCLIGIPAVDRARFPLIQLLLIAVLGLAAPAEADGPQVFSTGAGTLLVEIVEGASAASCTGSIEFARAGLDCADFGFRAISSSTLNRCCVQSCSATATGTMVITVYVDPSTGEPLPAASGGSPRTAFPAGSWLVGVGSMPRVSTSVGSSTGGSAMAELTIGSRTISVSAPGGTSSAVLDSVPILDGSAIPVLVAASHTDARGRLGFASIPCAPGEGSDGYELRTPGPIEPPVSGARKSWGGIKSRY